MQTGSHKTKIGLDELQIVVTNIMDVHFGIDTDLIDKITSPEEAEKDKIDIFPFHTKIDSVSGPARYICPKVLLYSPGPERTVGVIVEKPEDILTFRTSLIVPLPPLIKKKIKHPALWGILTSADRVILLTDLSKLTF